MDIASSYWLTSNPKPVGHKKDMTSKHWGYKGNYQSKNIYAQNHTAKRAGYQSYQHNTSPNQAYIISFPVTYF